MTDTKSRTECVADNCDRTDTVARGMCRRHYNRWRYHNPHITIDNAARTLKQVRAELAEYEFMRAQGYTPLQACRRINRHPRTVIRWHRRLGRAEPDGLWHAHNVIAEERRRKEQAG